MNEKPKTTAKKTIRAASKTTAAYWSKKIYLEKKDGWQSATYFVRMQAKGVRKKVRLESSVKEDAATEAADLYLDILAKGWPADEEFSLLAPATADLSKDPTVAEWIEMAKHKADGCGVRPESVAKYSESLRTVVSEILGMRRARKTEERAKIDAFHISGLTKEVLQTWVASRMESARQLDTIKNLRAHNTIRSLVTNAKALFSERILEAIGVLEGSLPYVPFHRLRLPAKFAPGYSSRYNPELLMRAAANELGSATGAILSEAAASRYEQWKILYLAQVAGLRFKEIDNLRVQDISIKANRITVRTQETFKPKTASSAAEVLVSPDAGKVLAKMLEHTTGPWFIKGGRSQQNHYRAGLYHDELISWMRNYKEGDFRPFTDVQKPIHELRKEAGTLVNELHGLNETKNFLRHSSITTTAASYVGSKGNITTGLS